MVVKYLGKVDFLFPYPAHSGTVHDSARPVAGTVRTVRVQTDKGIARPMADFPRKAQDRFLIRASASAAFLNSYGGFTP